MVIVGGVTMPAAACRFCGADPNAVVVASWSFLVPVILPSANAHVVNAGSSRHRYKRIRTRCEDACWALRRSMKIPPITTKARVVFERRYSGAQRPFDHGNWVSACKPFLDAMVNEGMLAGDTAAHLEDHYRQERVRDRLDAGVWVTLEVLG